MNTLLEPPSRYPLPASRLRAATVFQSESPTPLFLKLGHVSAALCVRARYAHALTLRVCE